jgi:hypothetical protein
MSRKLISSVIAEIVRDGMRAARGRQSNGDEERALVK